MMASHKKRREPADVPPVEAAGLRYEAPHGGAVLGYAQDGGIVTARDATLGHLVWSQRVYRVTYSADIEEDKQENFVTRLELTPDGQSLWVDNEHGERWRLALSDRSVERVAAPA